MGRRRQRQKQSSLAGQAESWEKAVNDDGTVTYAIKMRDGMQNGLTAKRRNCR